MAGARHSKRARRCGFTLIELILVMTLLAIIAAVTAPRLSSFFRGRALDHEAKRFMALTRHAQSRAVAEGIPMQLWVNTAERSYGLQPQSGYAGRDEAPLTYTLESDLSLECTDPDPAFRDESSGIQEGQSAIIFTPDGSISEASLTQVLIKQSNGSAVRIVQSSHLQGYELQPVNETEQP
jgi:type II secretion system protein H